MTKPICPVAAAHRDKVRRERLERAIALYLEGFSAHRAATYIGLCRQALIPHLRARGIYRDPIEDAAELFAAHIERTVKSEAQIAALYAFENYGHHDLKITAKTTLGWIPTPDSRSYTGNSSDMCASLA
jgi:hypothetical protein